METKTKRRVAWIACFLSIAGLAVLGIFLGTAQYAIPPDSLTVTRMNVLKRRIIQFARANDKLPDDLANLPVIAGYDNETRDGWHRLILFAADKNEAITLTSLGADGMHADDGRGRDIVRSFPLKAADGSWSEENVDWVK